MYDMVHQMRSRIITSKSFNGDVSQLHDMFQYAG